MDWLRTATDGELAEELRGGFQHLPDSRGPVTSPHLEFAHGRDGYVYVRYRSVPVYRDLLYLWPGRAPDVGGIVWFIRNRFPVGDDVPQDASLSEEEWVVRDVQES